MPPYRQIGSIPRKRHIAHRHEPGFRKEGIYYEEVVTTAGFGRAYSICYHLRPPTRVRKVETAGPLHAMEIFPDMVIRHHHLRTGTLRRSGDPTGRRVGHLTDEDVTLTRGRADA